jgi:hypothetical protein
MSELQAPYIVRDEIMDRWCELSLMNNIPDMQEYAKDWQRLAILANQNGRYSTAQTCRTRAEHYCNMAGGEYIRLVEGCFAELILVPACAGEETK